MVRSGVCQVHLSINKESIIKNKENKQYEKINYMLDRCGWYGCLL